MLLFNLAVWHFVNQPQLSDGNIFLMNPGRNLDKVTFLVITVKV